MQLLNLISIQSLIVHIHVISCEQPINQINQAEILRPLIFQCFHV